MIRTSAPSETVDFTVFTSAVMHCFPAKKISHIQMASSEIVNWKVYEIDQDDTDTVSLDPCTEYYKFDIRFVKHALKSLFSFKAVHIEYQGFIGGTIYFE